MARRFRVLLVLSATLAAGGWLAGGVAPAPAQPADLSGSAVALSVNVGSAPLVPATPGGVSAAGGGAFTPIARFVPTVGVPGLASVAELDASTDGTPAGDGAVQVTSSASVGALSLASGLVTAGAVSSTCSANRLGASASTVIDALTVAGVQVPAGAAPNTSVDVPGLVHGTLNEQVPDAGGGGIMVRAAHLQVYVTNGGPQLLDVVVAESRCSVVGAAIPMAPTSTPTTRGRRPPTTIGPRPQPTSPASTAVPATTTPPVPPAAPPGPPPTAPPGPAPAVHTSTSGGGATGPPGADVDVSATGFDGCGEIRLLFDQTQIGTARPDQAGTATARGLSVPGAADAGDHTVAATCRADGRLLRATSGFTVVEAPAHRSAFATALAEPRQIGTTARSLLVSVVATVALMLAAAFPSELFNSTLDENYAEVRGWFGLAPNSDPGGRAHQGLAFVGFVLLGGLLYGFLSPDLAFNRSSAALVLGLSLSLVVISVGFRLPHLIYLHHRDHEWVRFHVLPGTALVAIVCVTVSRLVHFQPGYLYGLIAGLSFRRRLATDTNGALTAASAIGVFVLAMAAWVARVPVSAAAARPGAGIWTLALEACLAAVTILGLETVVICLIPVRFVEGSKLAAWSRTAWALVFALCTFAFVHILLRPDSGYVAASTSRWTVAILFVVFGALSVGFWAYFRFRPARPAAAST